MWLGDTLERRRQCACFKPVSIGQDSRWMFEIGAAHVLYAPLRKILLQGKRGPLGTIQAGYPMQIVAVDILGPLPNSKEGNVS